MKKGRPLFEILEDPYVRNRVPQKRRVALLKDEQLLAAFEAELRGLPSPEDFPTLDDLKIQKELDEKPAEIADYDEYLEFKKLQNMRRPR
ncbi:MAG: hypothetical protein FWD41_00985 [Actinomycetia bacterium]|nr:hypothetical protein [Actinomycetes bacterium]